MIPLPDLIDCQQVKLITSDAKSCRVSANFPSRRFRLRLYEFDMYGSDWNSHASLLIAVCNLLINPPSLPLRMGVDFGCTCDISISHSELLSCCAVSRIVICLT
ncbi:hypothetical protein TNIN_378181 [Trichonephila inaurata madagascariensis]|uniref:Uncharacterized protein n=1 Tax=Trichonephila inaurata madagascariensis TaxID=2747483 RepID=A0A8X7CKP4_9ARAC|nr:hypothetical protein TNIN_378181 [Trichonephila inaurata madagascariensis]